MLYVVFPQSKCNFIRAWALHNPTNSAARYLRRNYDILTYSETKHPCSGLHSLQHEWQRGRLFLSRIFGRRKFCIITSLDNSGKKDITILLVEDVLNKCKHQHKIIGHSWPTFLKTLLYELIINSSSLWEWSIIHIYKRHG